MILSKENISSITTVSTPVAALFDLPVKVLQFGTGVLLRGLPDYLIDKANRNSIFNGRITVVKSTGVGDLEPFAAQDGLYTVSVKGIVNGTKVEEQTICSAIRKVLFAGTEWSEIIKQADNPHLSVIISNTTETGIQYIEELITQSPPASFPAKLLAVLYRRFNVFEGDPKSGLVIIPTELLPDNGKVLKEIVIKLSRLNNLGDAFVSWLENDNFFCSSLVDRIVPGKLPTAEQRSFEEIFGYRDDLAIQAEPYHLWAIAGDEKIRAKLSFEQADDGVVVTPDINLFRELKLRLLNGTHTLSSAVACLLGFDTVTGAMGNKAFFHFIKDIMNEISVAIPYPCEKEAITEFSGQVLDRFSNPFIQHKWINIAQQCTTKLKMRVVPVLLEYYRKHNNVPRHIAFGFAACFVFLKMEKFSVTDDHAAVFLKAWQTEDPSQIADKLLKEQLLWGNDLTQLPGFAETVQKYIMIILAGNTPNLLNELSAVVK